jgi:hypothetical protein
LTKIRNLGDEPVPFGWHHADAKSNVEGSRDKENTVDKLRVAVNRDSIATAEMVGATPVSTLCPLYIES